MGAAPPTAPNVSPFTLTISAERNTVVIGSPILVRTALTNNSDQDVHTIAIMGDGYVAHVRAVSGTIPPPTKWTFYHDYKFNVVPTLTAPNDPDPRQLLGNAVNETYKAHESDIGTCHVDDLYNFDTPGTYIIDLRWGSVISNPLTVTIIASAAPSEAASLPTSSSPALSVEIKSSVLSPQYSTKVGTPIEVTVITKNVSAHRIVMRRQKESYDPALLGPVFRVDVRAVQGPSPPDARLGVTANHLLDARPDPALRVAARAAGTLVSLEPGEDWRNTLRLDDLYELRKPGEYRVQVRRWDDESMTWVASNLVTVTVTP